NSWGENWGNDNGYFYLSYYDISALRLGENDGAFAIILNDSIKYDKNYQYDIGKTDYFFNSTDTVWYKNVFTATGNEYLSAVSTYFQKPTNWEVSVYVNDVLKSTKSGFSNPGYWTIDLFEHIPLIKGDIFEVVFKINVTGDAGFPIAEKVSLNNEFFKEGISFFSYDGVNWSDLYSIVWNDYPGHHYNNSQVACIKAFTVFDMIDTVTSLDIEYDGFNPVNITAHIINQYGNPVNCGVVLFNLSDVVIPVNVSNGVAKITHIFEKGLNTIFAEFVACGYVTSKANETIDIRKIPVNMVANISVDLDTALVNITLNDSINETIFIDLGDVNYTIRSFDGIASINLTGLNVGLHNVRVSLYDAVYESDDVELNFTIDSRRTIITLENIQTVYQSGKEYKIILTDEDGNPLGGRVLEYTLNNFTDALLTDENGEAYLNISLKTGSYKLNVKFLGEKLYIASNGTSTITVKTSVIPQYSNYTYGSKYSVKFLGKDSNPLKNTTVSIVFAGKTYNVKTDANGVAKIDVKLKPGTYTVKIINPNTSEEKTQKIKVLSRITENKNLVMYYGSGSKYKVKVLDDYGNIAKNVSVKFTYRGKTYNKRTDNKGYAYLIIKSKPNKYAISVTYKGFTVKNNITVKPTIIAKNITKKRAKTVKYTAKLLNSKGKILKSKYIKFKFKSKTYKRKTNSKGIATLSLKYLKKGKYSVYLTYGKLTVKRTIKIT
ncbi:lectin like domain-containing protein, partial [Methanobrevibacter sp.]|uniref:lectin like domain-containing protein n=1 Tax=Methanobrevibacter sp. TaxID=66852 RepID=UPI00388F0D35